MRDETRAQCFAAPDFFRESPMPTHVDRGICRHCHCKPVARPRGLCWPCYYRPGVRECYPSVSKFARHGLGTGNRRPAPPAQPTTALPGSQEKLEVLQQRAGLRQELWHSGDATVDLD